MSEIYDFSLEIFLQELKRHICDEIKDSSEREEFQHGRQYELGKASEFIDRFFNPEQEIEEDEESTHA